MKTKTMKKKQIIPKTITVIKEQNKSPCFISFFSAIVTLTLPHHPFWKRRLGHIFRSTVVLVDTRSKRLQFNTKRKNEKILEENTYLTIKMRRHKHSSPTLWLRTLSSQSSNFPSIIDFIIFQNSQLDLLLFVLDFLGGSVLLLLSLFTTTSKAEDEVEGWLFLNVVVGKGAAVFKLFSSENEALLVWGDSCVWVEWTRGLCESIKKH